MGRFETKTQGGLVLEKFEKEAAKKLKQEAARREEIFKVGLAGSLEGQGREEKGERGAWG